jgi:hypothetical protein
MSALEEVVAQLLLRQPAPLLRPLHIQVGALPYPNTNPSRLVPAPCAQAATTLLHCKMR